MDIIMKKGKSRTTIVMKTPRGRKWVADNMVMKAADIENEFVEELAIDMESDGLEVEVK